MNREKTQLFEAGLSLLESQTNAGYGFSKGSLPIRYLGLPLTSRKLRISEYAPLIEKITSRFQSWAVKTLSFSGRLQLISSVISGTVNFWISTFILPRGCIKKIESLCSRFLWSGGCESGRHAKVAWPTVCLPKSEGGLGLRRFTVWNRVLCLRFIWLLFANSGSLWVAWHKRYNFKSASHFWFQEVSSKDSWTWKFLLNLRPLAAKFLRCSIGNGRKGSFWGDNWTPFGPLLKFIGDHGPRDLRIPLRATIYDACKRGVWSLASPRSDKALALHTFLTTLSLPLNPTVEDSYGWFMGEVKLPAFSSAKTWEALRPRESKKGWTSSVWFKGATPRHAFTMWAATLDRLPVRSRLTSWGMQVSPLCVLCSNSPENRDHLFLACSYSSAIWKECLQRLSLHQRAFSSWAELLNWTVQSDTSSPSTLRKILAQAVIYGVWKQRNNCLHNAISIQPLTVFNGINRQIINTINARRSRKKFRNLMGAWLS